MRHVDKTLQKGVPVVTPIPTRYAGIDFRSRLEADYAATFDSVHLPWQYEPEGFKLSDGTWYLPDFYLPSARAWCEVKGDHNERIDKVEQFATDLWEEAGQPHYEAPTAPLVILATPPRNYDREIGWRRPDEKWRPQLVGIRAAGKRYSIAITQCEHCRQVTIIALWSRACRGCGWIYFEEEHPDVSDSPLASPVFDYWRQTSFVRASRP